MNKEEIFKKALIKFRQSNGEEREPTDKSVQWMAWLWENTKSRNPEKAGYYQDLGLKGESATAMKALVENGKNSPQAKHLDGMEENGKYLVMLSEQLMQVLDEIDEGMYALEHEDEKIEVLDIDIETYCDVSVADTGVYRYAEDDSFEILLFAYAINGGKTFIVDLASGEELPKKVLDALTDESVLKIAHNASFERICLSRYLKDKGILTEGFLDSKQWDCTMVRAARLGLPLSLDQLGKVLGIEKKKMTEGKALIKFFCCPCKPTKANGGRSRNLPHHAPDKWATFKDYCKRDVDAEKEIGKKVLNKPVAEWDRSLWELDQRINDRGVKVDIKMAKTCCYLDNEVKEELTEEAKRLMQKVITDQEPNPGSMVQLKAYFKKAEGLDIKSLDKVSLPEVMKSCKNEDSLRLLRIRKELGKTSNNKYATMLTCACKDERVRGITQFYGASRTGRWSGRLVQLQNLPQNHIPDIDYARRLVRMGDLEEIEMCYGNITQLLSELIRTALVAKDGYTFHVCDFSAIECRVLAWLAKEEWVLDTFRQGGDIYCATASKMFGVPVEKHGQNAELRQKGKIATLALGYEGGVGALSAMGGERMGLKQDEMKEIVQTWRNANPNIVKFWRTVENAARYAVENHEECEITSIGLKFKYIWGGLRVTLPSGRFIFYPRMKTGQELMANGKYKDVLIYEGQNQTTKHWEEVYTYGGKMTENITQAIARDLLGVKMLDMDKEGCEIVFHVHDEAITEAPVGGDITLEKIEEIFAREVSWCKGLPLKGAGYTTPYYMKD